jgi:hypothetical protein
MMKGNNTLELNQATMVEALQLWAEHTFKNAPKVVVVRQKPLNHSTSFEVEIAEAEER